jgi:hypothetical protein
MACVCLVDPAALRHLRRSIVESGMHAGIFMVGFLLHWLSTLAQYAGSVRWLIHWLSTLEDCKLRPLRWFSSTVTVPPAMLARTRVLHPQHSPQPPQHTPTAPPPLLPAPLPAAGLSSAALKPLGASSLADITLLREAVKSGAFLWLKSQLWGKPDRWIQVGGQVVAGGGGWWQVLAGGGRWWQVVAGGGRWWRAAGGLHSAAQCTWLGTADACSGCSSENTPC